MHISNLEFSSVELLTEIECEWAEWSPCSQSCGGGVRKRQTITNRLKDNGHCASVYEKAVCNDEICPGNY